MCQTDTCRGAASAILNNIDLSVDPCDDFYQFSCGSFVKNVHVPQGENHYNLLKKFELETNSRVVELLASPLDDKDFEATVKAKNYYQLCLKNGCSKI